MLRNVVVLRLKPGVSRKNVDNLKAELESMKILGLLRLTAGRDLGLREGNADLAIVSDLVDEAAYRAYDADEEHNRIRRELVAPIAASIERCQFLID